MITFTLVILIKTMFYNPKYVPLDDNGNIPKKKSMGRTIFFTLLIGGFGMYYSTRSNVDATIMSVIDGFLFLFTLGIGTILTRPFTVGMAIINTINYNRDIIASHGRYGSE